MNEALYIGNRSRIVKALHLLPGWQILFAVEKDSLAHKAATECGVDTVVYNETEKEKVNKLLKQRPWNLVITAGCPFLLNSSNLSPITYAINCHPGLLPTHPGKHPVSSSIFNNFDPQGVTIHRIATEQDPGDILLQKSLGPMMNCDLHEIYNIIFKLEAELLLEVIRHLTYYQPQAKPQTQVKDSAYKHEPAQQFLKITDTTCKQVLTYSKIYSLPHFGGIRLGTQPQITIWDCSPITDVNYLQFYPLAKVGQVASLYEIGGTKRFILCLKDGFVRINLFSCKEELKEGQIIID